MLELAIWMYHIGNPDPVVRVITDVATSLVILWGVVNHYAKKESDKEFMDVYNEMRNWKAVAHYNAEQAQELRERLNEKWEDRPGRNGLLQLARQRKASPERPRRPGAALAQRGKDCTGTVREYAAVCEVR